MKPIKTELHIYWDDDVTIEVRYFRSISLAKAYVKQNGVDKYKIYRQN
jgi:hypothetical protein